MTVLNRGAQLLLRVVRQRSDQAVDRLALVLRHLCERGAACERLVELLLRHAEVGRCDVEAAREGAAVMAEAAGAAEIAVRPGEERQVAGLEPRLQSVALGLGEGAR